MLVSTALRLQNSRLQGDRAYAVLRLPGVADLARHDRGAIRIGCVRRLIAYMGSADIAFAVQHPGAPESAADEHHRAHKIEGVVGTIMGVNLGRSAGRDGGD